MNIVYASDENYVQHMAVSIVSLLENNRDVDEIVIYVVANAVSQASIQWLYQLVESRYNRQLAIIDFAQYKDQLNLNMEWPISLSSYSRLFLSEMLPSNCNRVIYLDCDTIVSQSLQSMWEFDLRTSSVAGVMDCVLPQYKEAVEIQKDGRYFNAGVLLIDMANWRANNVQQQFMQFIDKHHGRISHHDQGVINGVLQGQIAVLSPQYNTMTPFFTTNYSNLRYLYRINGEYYDKHQLNKARKDPVIIHYVPEFVGRVWESDCTHPKKDLYRQYLDMTPWKDNITPAQKRYSLKEKMIHKMQCRCPVLLLRLLEK